ncbi:MAG: Beta-glucosidase [Acidimicrobiaceae bacterium]|nr:Beta-glucosidase [Acidimicrobiaceae bacterium]
MTTPFPDGFLWGASTSAYQVEGAVSEDGRGPSIWDRFSHEPDRIEGGGTGDVACDHYHRYPEDLDLLAGIGLNAYRFSIAWPRVQPAGSGAFEARGLSHYDRMIDAMLERDITPLVTLYHWDLPIPLQDKGGWAARETAERFGEYAQACFSAYGDRVRIWVSQNEPWIVSLLGHELGLHAPGHRDLREAVTVGHHLLLAHGRAAAALEAAGLGDGSRIGVAHSLFPHEPASASAEDAEAARGSDGYVNRWYLDPLLKGRYPDDMRARYEERTGPLDFVQPGDLEAISARCDFIGVNYYTRRVVRHAADARPFPWKVIDAAPGMARTDAGWEVVPESFYDLLVRLARDYPGVEQIVTENGGVYNDAPGPDGQVRDGRRSAFIHDHLEAVARAIKAGAPVIGYCHWSLLDNFEWALGYDKRFGLVHVDYATQRRTLKASAAYYGSVASANALQAVPEDAGG